MNLHRLVPLILLLLLVPFTVAEDSTSAEQEIRRLHELQRKAFLEKDLSTLDRLFADDFIVTNPFGQFLNKQQTLARVRSGEIDFERFERTLDYVKVYGDAAVAAGTETMVPRAKMNGAGSTIRLRMTTMWIRQQGTWREVARHTSVMK